MDKVLKVDAAGYIQTVEDNHGSWCAKDPVGNVIGCNSFYYTLNGEPFIIKAGEMHMSRTDERFWEESVLRMKAGGLNTVSFYVIWLHHEQHPGEFNFSGNRNLRAFLEICKKHSMYAWPRIGPFVNSEVAHGGLPSWLYGMPVKERSNDPKYLFYVERYYREVAKQFEGMYFAEGGPIIGVQIENEYGHAPGLWNTFYPYGTRQNVNIGSDERHLEILKGIAKDAGINVPFYTATGWGESAVDEDEFIPTMGNYCFLSDCGPTSGSTFFIEAKNFKTPLTSCELGTGATPWKNWRPDIPPESVEVVLFNTIACGSNAAGFYMYHGGTNPKSYDRFFTSDSHVIYLPLMSYDFSAPIGEFGNVRDSYYQIRPLLGFMENFANELCAAYPVWQKEYKPENTEDIRYMVRANESSGFLFINNYQDKLEMPKREGLKFEIEFREERLSIPFDGGIGIAKNEMIVLALNMELSAAKLKYSTAQPVWRFTNTEEYIVFMKTEAMQPEYVFDDADDLCIVGAESVKKDGCVIVRPKENSIFAIENDGRKLSVITLDKNTAQHTMLAKVYGGEYLVHSDSVLTIEEECICAANFRSNVNSVEIFPKPAEDITGEYSQRGIWHSYCKTNEVIQPKAEITDYGDGRMVIHMSAEEIERVNDVYMDVRYQGDIARVFSNGLMLTDNYNTGREWLIGLKRLKEYVSGDGLYIKLLPDGDWGNVFESDGITLKQFARGAAVEAEFEKITFYPEYKNCF